MFKAIFFKEWLKTRWCLLAAFVLCSGFSIYIASRVMKAIELQGAGHIWEVTVSRDALFAEPITFVPLLIGLALGLFQYFPEMQRKCFKLTLHLPYPALRMTLAMLLYGLLWLSLCFIASILLLWIPLAQVFPSELSSRIVLSSLPWFAAGYAAYLFSAWITLEPTWKRRVFNMVIAAFCLKIFFMAPAPEAYNAFLPWISLCVIALISLVWLSVLRFKAGKQD